MVKITMTLQNDPQFIAEVLHAYTDGSLKSSDEVATALGRSRKIVIRVLKSRFSDTQLKERKKLRMERTQAEKILYVTPQILAWFNDPLDTTTSEQIGTLLKIRRAKVKAIVLEHHTLAEWHGKSALAYSRSKSGEFNPMKGKFGELHHNFIGDLLTDNGYIQCLKPDWFTGRTGSKHVFRHYLVICEELGLTEIPLGFEVHHVDFDKTNNSIANLALLTKSAHARLHQKSQLSNELTAWELHEFMTWRSKKTTAS